MHSFYLFGVKNLNLNHHEQAAWRGWDLGYPLQRLRASCDAGVGLSVPPCSPDLPSHPSWWLLHGKYSSLDLGGCRVGRPGYQPLLLGCCGDVHPGRGVCSLCPPAGGQPAGGKGRKRLWEMGSLPVSWQPGSEMLGKLKKGGNVCRWQEVRVMSG